MFEVTPPVKKIFVLKLKIFIKLKFNSFNFDVLIQNILIFKICNFKIIFFKQIRNIVFFVKFFKCLFLFKYNQTMSLNV